MKYTVVDTAEFTYPDICEYESSMDKIDIFSCRGGYASTQILLYGVDSDKITAQISGLPFECELYTLFAVDVEQNANLTEETSLPHYPERKAPFKIYDCLKPYDGTLQLTDGTGGFYLAVKIPRDASAGIYSGIFSVGEINIEISLMVYSAVLPDETLKIINGYSRVNVAKYHETEMGTFEFDVLDSKYLNMLRRMHQNMLYTPRASVTKLGDNKYSFDFSELENFMRCAISHGFKYFNGPSVGWRRSWHESTILLNGEIPSMSYEGYLYLSQYLPALHKMLEQNGWLDIFAMGVADEPNNENATEFRALCGLIRKFVPDIKLMDAMSYGNLHGALDIWIPLNAEYDKHKTELETLRADGAEIWHYVCCGPRGEGYINRFMDYPLLSTRFLFWGNYKYNLTGYLHWASNSYQPGQNPFTQNCPHHINVDSECTLPAGDTHIIYPGNGEPWMSIRLEAQRESAEEYELLCALALRNKAEADRICDSVFKSFNNVEYSTKKFRQAKKSLLEAMS